MMQIARKGNALSSTAITNASLEFIDNVTAAAVSDGRRDGVAASGNAQAWYVNAHFHTAHATLDPTLDQLALVGNKSCKAMSPNSGQTTCADEIYYAAILDADTQIGRLFEGLKTRGLWQNTVIAFSADNGPEVRWSYPNSVGTTGPFRGQKRSLYDGGVRLPFMMAWPSHGPGGNVDDATVASGVDWMPTVIALANLTSVVDPKFQATLRGHDISQTFVGKGIPALRPNEKPLLWEWRYSIEGPCYMEAPQLAILDPSGRFKLLMNPPSIANASGGARFELYSRAGTSDLFEINDLSTLLPEKVEELKTPLAQFHDELQAAWPGPEVPKPGCAGEPWPPVLKKGAAEGEDGDAATAHYSCTYPLQDP